MKIAVWRYSLGLQTELDSTVGGGRITSRVLEALRRAGHSVTVASKVSPQTGAWLAQQGIAVEPALMDLSDYQGALVLTGPANVMFKGMAETYERLASLPPGAKAAYAQWDSALNFQFHPDTAKAFREKCTVNWNRMHHLEWTLMTQIDEWFCRFSSSKSTGYGWVPYKYTRCLFELAEWSEPTLPICKSPIPAVGYFGSDRPGRLRELKRWFYQTGVPVHIHGRWSDKSKAQLACPNVEFKPPIPEGEVRSHLNRYALTLYMADPQYIKQNFIAQRFFENAMARVPTAYSDKLQPAVQSTVDQGLVVREPGQLKAMLDVAKSAYRGSLVALNQECVSRLAMASQEYAIAPALAKVFPCE